MSDYYASRGKGTGDEVAIWAGRPKRVASNGDVYFFNEWGPGGLKLGKQGSAAIKAIFPELLKLQPDNLIPITAPNVRLLLNG